MQTRSSFSIFAGFTLSVLGGLVFNLGGLGAGSAAATLLNSLKDMIPWIFLIYPLLLTVRGDINGILTGKLGTDLHLGNIKPSWRKNTENLKHLIFIILFLTIYDSFIIGCVTSVLGIILKLHSVFEVWTDVLLYVLKIFSITFTTFILTATISLIITFTLTFFIYRKKGDPDVLVYPITSSINDILITIIFFGVSWLYRPWKKNVYTHYYLGIPVIILVASFFIYAFIRYRKTSYFISAIKQSLPVLTVTSFIAAGTGSVLASLSFILSDVPILLVFYPVIISTVGSQNAILANTTTTKLHLGILEPNLKFLRTSDFAINFFGIISGAIIIVTTMSIIGVLLFPNLLPEGNPFRIYFLILGLLLLSNFLSFLLISIIALSVSLISFRFKLDPDNLVNPLLSSSADLVTTSILVLIFILLF